MKSDNLNLCEEKKKVKIFEENDQFGIIVTDNEKEIICRDLSNDRERVMDFVEALNCNDFPLKILDELIEDFIS